MKKTPLVSILVATYNQASFLRQALDSLLSQTLPRDRMEVVVINDGSTDGTSALLDRYAHDFRVLFRENRGLVATCNEGLALARGDYFARLDSDDFASPHWIERLLTVLEGDRAACCVYPDRYEITDGEWRLVRSQDGNLYSLEACGTLFRTDALREVGGFRPFFWEEYDLYLRLLKKGKFLHVHNPLYMYRLHQGGMTSNLARRRAGWEELIRAWGADALVAAGYEPELELVIQNRTEKTS